jgi:phospholipase C
MKIIKRFIPITLVVCFLMLSVVYANNNVSIGEQKRIVKEIASGTSDTLVGAGVTADVPKLEGTIQPMWSSGGLMHTHQYLAARGILILENDKTNNVSKHLYESNGTSIIMEYADKPDDTENDLLTYAGHFYCPTDGHNWQGFDYPTALSRYSEHFNNALNSFSSNKILAWQELGMAIHYLSDACETHHACNLIRGLTNHTEYETWVDDNRFNYNIDHSDKYDINIWDYKKLIDGCAYNAMDYESYATDSSSNKTAYWDVAARNTLSYAQKTIASVLYHFLAGVGELS